MQRETTEKRPGGITGKGWRKGQSGNAEGRPKGLPRLTTLIMAELESDPGCVQRIVRAFLKRCQAGDLAAIRELMDRTEGKVRDRLEVETKPIRYVVSFTGPARG